MAWIRLVLTQMPDALHSTRPAECRPAECSLSDTDSDLAEQKADARHWLAAHFPSSAYDLCWQALPTPAFKRKETEVKELEGRAMLALGL